MEEIYEEGKIGYVVIKRPFKQEPAVERGGEELKTRLHASQSIDMVNFCF
jgi:hypothetical protein